MTAQGNQDDPSIPSVTNIAVSLSGGGYRASSFGAGALLALVDLGLGPDIGSVSSVSGGSIANVLSIGGFKSTAAMDRCAAQIGGLATTDAIRVENRLKFIKEAHIGILIGAGIPILVLLLILNPSSFLGTAGGIAALLAGLVILNLIGLMYLSNGEVERTIDFIIGGPLSLSELATKNDDGAVVRVVCATDLDANGHVLVGTTWVQSSRLGLAPTSPLSTGVAVGASAAFPGFRPVRVEARSLGYSESTAEPLALVDGGVWDNLGTAHALAMGDPLLAKLLGSPSHLVVVDASGASRGKRTGLARWIPSRLQYLIGTASLVSRANMEGRYLAIDSWLKRPDGNIDGEIIALRDAPQVPTDIDIDTQEIAARNQQVSTSLGAMAPRVVAELMFHGYWRTRAAMLGHGWGEVERAGGSRSLESFIALVTVGRDELDALSPPPSARAARRKAIRSRIVIAVVLGCAIVVYGFLTFRAALQN